MVPLDAKRGVAHPHRCDEEALVQSASKGVHMLSLAKEGGNTQSDATRLQGQGGTAHLCGGEAEAKLANKGVHMLGLADEGEQVHHDGLEALLRQPSILAHAGQHVWQEVVDGACALCQHKVLVTTTWQLCSVFHANCAAQQP